MTSLKDSFERNKKWLLWAMLSTFAWGLAAHGYGFLHDAFSHDSLSGFGGDTGDAWKISLGRFLVPVYRSVFRTELTLPWMVGLLSLVWTGLAVFLVIRMFRIENKALIVLTSGIFIANLTIAATGATYIHDLDGNLFGMLCSVAAAYLWKHVRFGELPGAVLIAASMALYQSYISVTIVLVLFVCILDLLDGESVSKVLLRGIRGAGMLLLGALCYSLVLKLALLLSGTDAASGSSNSLDNLLRLSPDNILALVGQAYTQCFARLTGVVSPYPAPLVKGITWTLLGLCAGMLVLVALKQKLGWMQSLLLAVLAALLPLGMNVTHVLSAGGSHDLMVYGIWLSYLLVLLLADRFGKQETKAAPVARILSGALVFVLLYSNVQVANVLYLKKDMEQEAHLSMMTRVLYRIEDYEGYIPGETLVVLAGHLGQLNDTIPGFEPYSKVTGAWRADPIYQLARYRVDAYFEAVLVNPIQLAPMGRWEEIQADPRVAEMPAYPAEDCIAMIDEVLVVKLG